MPGWLVVAIAGGAFAALLAGEILRPLRRRNESKPRRNIRNFAVGALSAAAIHLTEMPVAQPLARRASEKRWGLLPRFRLPRIVETIAGVVLLDYTLYLWHVLTHKVPFLWRFHRVHHVDLDCDASTAIRFHFGEMILSVAWRGIQIIVIGVTPRTLSIWSTCTLASILFHHSNLRLPRRWERRISRFFVTPRLHGIHHSRVLDEMDSNWSSGLTLWDRIHGTLRNDVPQSLVRIGVAGWDFPDQVTFPKLMRMPAEFDGTRLGPPSRADINASNA